MSPADPTQGDVLRERASRVPWRRAARHALWGLAGRGPMALPDRLEGAVYGHLAGAAAAGADPAVLLDRLEERLGTAAMRPPVGGAASGLAVALVDRAEPAPDVVAAVDAGREPGDPRATVDILYALVARRLLGGQRSGPALTAARREAAGIASAHDRSRLAQTIPPAFDAAWRAFDGARDPVHALTRLAAGRDAEAAAIAGGLAGARWGGSAMPAEWRRAVPSPARARRVLDRLIETDTPGGDDRGWQTSTSNPVVVHDLDLSGLDVPAAAAIGITPLPGRRYVAYHTGAHWRDLDTDARQLEELGIRLLLLLVEDRELARCRVTDLVAVLGSMGVEVVRFPIRDPLVPRDGTAFRTTVARVLDGARGGDRVAIACRGGLDRAGMTAACLLREAGLDATSAIERVQQARPGALTLPDQQAYVRAWPPPG